MTSEDGLGPDVFGPGNFVVNPTTFTKETIDEAFEKNDLSEHGQLTINEFVNAMISLLKEKKSEEQFFTEEFDDYPDAMETDRSRLEYVTRVGFETADEDGNGLLTDREMMTMFPKIQILYKFDKDGVNTFLLDMIRLNDADENGLDIDEFLNFMVKTMAILSRTLDAADVTM